MCLLTKYHAHTERHLPIDSTRSTVRLKWPQEEEGIMEMVELERELERQRKLWVFTLLLSQWGDCHTQGLHVIDGETFLFSREDASYSMFSQI